MHFLTYAALVMRSVIVDAALRDLAALDARLAQMVELRYFGGLTDVEIGEALNISDRTFRRDWDKARMLAHALRA